MNSPDMIVISGAGTGIGRAAARRLVADGFHVLAVGRRPDPLERLAKELAPHLDTVRADLATVTGATAVAENVRAAERPCAGIVAAAGGVSPGGDGATGLDGVRQDWLASFESNVLTAVLLVEALHEALERDGGRVVLLSSVAALRGSGGGAYGAVKSALHGYVYDLARKLGAHGGTANVVAPGFVPDTEYWAGRLTGESRRERAAQTLVGREGTPEEVASLIAWLLGPDGGWVTGQVLSPNGGVVLGR
jgi:3-oxoacyl-[acyl-carrier protein] reductase